MYQNFQWKADYIQYNPVGSVCIRRAIVWIQMSHKESSHDHLVKATVSLNKNVAEIFKGDFTREQGESIITQLLMTLLSNSEFCNKLNSDLFDVCHK